MACTRHWRPKSKVSQLDFLGLKTNVCDTYMCHKAQMCSASDHHPENAVSQKDEEEKKIDMVATTIRRTRGEVQEDGASEG